MVNSSKNAVIFVFRITRVRSVVLFEFLNDIHSLCNYSFTADPNQWPTLQESLQKLQSGRNADVSEIWSENDSRQLDRACSQSHNKPFSTADLQCGIFIFIPIYCILTVIINAAVVPAGNSSCGKVMVSQASVSYSVHSGGRVSLFPGPFLVTGPMSLLGGRVSKVVGYLE